MVWVRDGSRDEEGSDDTLSIQAIALEVWILGQGCDWGG